MKIGRIYEIITSESDECYVGSTFNSLDHRFKNHKSAYKKYLKGEYSKISVYKLFDDYGIENCEIRQIKEYVVIDSNHLKVYETLWMKKKNSINKIQPIGGILKKQNKSRYYKENKERILRYYKQYREDKKEEIRIYKSEYYKENKLAAQKQHRQYYEKNKERMLQKCKQYYEENKLAAQKQHRQYYEENKERILQKCKQYREGKKEEIRINKSRYYEENKERILRYYKQYREDKKEELRINKSRYYEENKERILQKRKQYAESKKEEIRQKRKQLVRCDICNYEISKGNMSRHNKSKKHLKNLNNF